MDPLFRYHAGLNLLLMPHPVSGDPRDGKAIAIPTKSLREWGWKADDDELRRMLPRADRSPIVTPGEELDRLGFRRIQRGNGR